MRSIFHALFTTVLLVGCTNAQQADYDLVILGARVVDPETMLDQVRNIGISGTEIAVITADAITGREQIDASGLIAAPGFIDVHAHGQDPYSEKVSIFDGRSDTDGPGGRCAADPGILRRQGRSVSLSNYGVSVSHASARLLLMDGVDAQGSPMMTHALERAAATGNQWSIKLATDEELDKIDDLVRQGVDDGGIGIGVMVGYYPEARSEGRRADGASRRRKGQLPDDAPPFSQQPCS